MVALLGVRMPVGRGKLHPMHLPGSDPKTLKETKDISFVQVHRPYFKNTQFIVTIDVTKILLLATKDIEDNKVDRPHGL